MMKENVVEEEEEELDPRAKRMKEIQKAIDSLNTPVEYNKNSGKTNERENEEYNGEEVEGNEEDNNDTDQMLDDDAEKAWKLPISHEGNITGHLKTVSAIAIDRAGARFITGGGKVIYIYERVKHNYPLELHSFPCLHWEFITIPSDYTLSSLLRENERIQSAEGVIALRSLRLLIYIYIIYIYMYIYIYNNF